MAGVLAIDQDYDLVTRYGQAFRHHFVFSNFAVDYPGHVLHQCLNNDATRPKVDRLLNGNGVAFISAMGHGLYSAFTGQHGDPIWDASDDLTYLADKIIHLLSCQTGALLGRRMVEDGARAFWGYTVNFSFFHRNPPPSALETDKTAEIFFRMDAIVDRGILAGKTATEIYDSLTSYFATVYSKLHDPAHKAVLLDNFVHLVCPVTVWGEGGALL